VCVHISRMNVTIELHVVIYMCVRVHIYMCMYTRIDIKPVHVQHVWHKRACVPFHCQKTIDTKQRERSHERAHDAHTRTHTHAHEHTHMHTQTHRRVCWALYMYIPYTHARTFRRRKRWGPLRPHPSLCDMTDSEMLRESSMCTRHDSFTCATWSWGETSSFPPSLVWRNEFRKVLVTRPYLRDITHSRVWHKAEGLFVPDPLLYGVMHSEMWCDPTIYTWHDLFTCVT